MFNIAIKNFLEKHGFEALRLKAVLFDMDGVLYDSMPSHAMAWQRAMSTFGIEMTTADAYATEGARGIDTIRTMVLRQQGRDISLDEAQSMYDEKTRQFHALPETSIMEGIPTLLSQLRDARLTMGVVTGSGQRPLIRRLLTDFGPYLEERHIVTAYDVSQGKPSPDPYLKGLQKVGCQHPWEAVVVENAPLGVRAGVAARIFTIAVNTGPLPDEALLSQGADLLFSRMTELSEHWNDFYKETL